MFTLGVRDHIMIAHSFPSPFFGPAQRIHGATYAVEAIVKSSSLGPEHVVMDIGALRSILRAALASLDYQNLDDHPSFQAIFSTTERVAEHIAELVAKGIAAAASSARPPAGSSLRIVLGESPVAWAAFKRLL
jgi:6-pyruvoyltetrahydropterin/6-carboxytetrahydropterin synthase